MKNYNLNEDRRPQKLKVNVSPQIDNKIDAIYDYNQNNPKALFQWFDYIDGIKDYISNPVIAYDYTHKYTHFPNGAIYLTDFDYDVGFIVRTNRFGKSYVYIFKLDLKTQKFGLKVPWQIQESRIHKNVIHITESQISQMVRETLRRVLLTA